ncbi:hypothetical protein SAMN05216486_10837 [bacterium JGI 053]|nr:hypothetical protein SAMN05216486_10837 [bacterium JGI 053]
MWMRPAAAVLGAALAAGCSRGGGGAGEGKAGEPSAEARQDSSRQVQQALRDSGVSVDTQKIDTGTARATPAEDN